MRFDDRGDLEQAYWYNIRPHQVTLMYPSHAVNISTWCFHLNLI